MSQLSQTPFVRALNACQAYTDKRAVSLFLLGFSAGMPILLIFSTLSVWLVEAGVDRKMVTMLSLAGLGYAFKFVWSPLMDVMAIWGLSRLGKRRSWLLFAQILIISAIFLMGNVNPSVAGSLSMMALAAVLLGFSSATQDVVIDAYRIEIAPEDSAMQSVLSAMYTSGYRVGMIVTGAGSLFLASYFGSTKEAYVYEAWRNTYWLMAGVMGVGVLTTLWIPEPSTSRERKNRFTVMENVRLLILFVLAVLAFISAFVQLGAILTVAKASPILTLLLETLRLGGALSAAIIVGYVAVKLGLAPKHVVVETWISPLSDFFQRYGKKAILLLMLIGLYRISDIVSGVMSNIFYTDMGFSKEEIAWAVKTFGVIMSIVGGFFGGILAQRFRVMNMMMLGAIAASATNLLFVWLALSGKNVGLMYFAVGLDNFAAGLAATVFVAFLSALTNIQFTAVQYALFSSLMTLLPKTLGGYSGAMVENMGYVGFYTFTAVLGVPILVLIYLVDKQLFRNPK